ncbi:serine/threonine-protein kinase [Streptomyces sp. CB00455]|uniref:serine/threonine-protein kinase n=1 Tax=Streptomyces sp. CB00455 TaxID=1703927 RepID=UPI00094029E1|nr:serine/threonine-protein kinase [Streptomyces sp. CB00455]
MAAVFPRRLALRFDPVRIVGQGGMGTVFEAEDTRLRRRVAVKVLTAYGPVSESAAERFEAEALALGRISHPNVVGVHDVGVEDGAPYLVMEYLDGSDVSELVRRSGALPVAEACRIAAETLAGLGAAHARGVLHRDVKPANVRVTAQGRVVLYDFGLARLTDETAISLPGDLLGTPQYMAPECISGRPPQPASDVYGVGACLYFMLSGSLPFEDAPGVQALLFRAVEEGIPSLRGTPAAVPDALADAVEALSAREVSARTPTARAAEALVRPWAQPSAGAHLPGTRDPVPEPRDPAPGAHVPAPGRHLPAPEPHDPAPEPPVRRPARTVEVPEYDWQQVDTGPPRVPAADPRHIALSETTRRLVRSRMTGQTALARQREAVGLILRGDLREAADLLSGLGAFCAQSLGPADPTTLTCQYWHAVCLARLGEAPKALELFARVSAHHGQGRDTADA